MWGERAWAARGWVRQRFQRAWPCRQARRRAGCKAQGERTLYAPAAQVVQEEEEREEELVVVVVVVVLVERQRRQG